MEKKSVDRGWGNHKQPVECPRARNSRHHIILRNRGLCGKDLLIVTEISHLGDPKESALRESTSKHRPQTNKTLHYHLPPLHYSGTFSTGTWASWFQSLHHSCSDTSMTTVLTSISGTLWQQDKLQITSLSISWGSLICRIPKEISTPGCIPQRDRPTMISGVQASGSLKILTWRVHDGNL